MTASPVCYVCVSIDGLMYFLILRPTLIPTNPGGATAPVVHWSVLRWFREAIVCGESTGRSCPCGSDGQFEHRAPVSTTYSVACFSTQQICIIWIFPRKVVLTEARLRVLVAELETVRNQSIGLQSLDEWSIGLDVSCVALFRFTCGAKSEIRMGLLTSGAFATALLSILLIYYSVISLEASAEEDFSSNEVKVTSRFLRGEYFYLFGHRGGRIIFLEVV